MRARGSIGPRALRLGTTCGAAAQRPQDGEELLAFLDMTSTSCSRAQHGPVQPSIRQRRLLRPTPGSRPTWARLACSTSPGHQRRRGSRPRRGCVARGQAAARTRHSCIGRPHGDTPVHRGVGAGSRQLPLLPDLHCAWLRLAYCASPRANHALRLCRPS